MIKARMFAKAIERNLFLNVLLHIIVWNLQCITRRSKILGGWLGKNWMLCVCEFPP